LFGIPVEFRIHEIEELRGVPSEDRFSITKAFFERKSAIFFT
jgi:hypothetical protein